MAKSEIATSAEHARTRSNTPSTPRTNHLAKAIIWNPARPPSQRGRGTRKILGEKRAARCRTALISSRSQSELRFMKCTWRY